MSRAEPLSVPGRRMYVSRAGAADSESRPGRYALPATPRAARTSVSPSLPWPGITTGNDARCWCTWAPMAGVMQVKHLHAGCPTHRRTSSA